MSDTELGTVAREFVRELRGWHPAVSEQESLRAEYLAFVLDRAEAAFDRESGAEHITASCFVFTPDRANVLLCFHKKGRFWVQLGGHIEADDASVASAALREAREESGIDAIQPISAAAAGSAPAVSAPLAAVLTDSALRSNVQDDAMLVDVDRHSLSAGFVRCAVHWDVGYAAVAAFGSVPAASDESEDVRWWPVDALPGHVPDGFTQRMARVLDGIAKRYG